MSSNAPLVPPAPTAFGRTNATGDNEEPQEEGFYWVVVGQNPPEIAYRERGEWLLCGQEHPGNRCRDCCQQPPRLQTATGSCGMIFRP
jgi:hypothetical protein